jgi:outer membrane lipoprotein LolB
MFARVISKILPELRCSRAAGLGICLLVLTGCAVSRPLTNLPDISSWELRQDVLRQVDDWGFKGRIAVKAGDDGFNGKFNWTQTGDEFDARVGGPLGMGTVRVAGDDRSIVLTDKDGVKTRLTDPETELMIRYGWTIPVASLRFWALGIPDPALPADTRFDEAGRLVHLEQSNWIVTISRYRESAGQQMPRTLTASNPDTRVRMVIDKWSFYK